jgi:hypothetical protein
VVYVPPWGEKMGEERVGMSLYVAVRVTEEAGMVTVVVEELMLVTFAVSPVHLSKTLLVGGVLAEMVTVVDCV